jgi:hypothetical protein
MRTTTRIARRADPPYSGPSLRLSRAGVLKHLVRCAVRFLAPEEEHRERARLLGIVADPNSSKHQRAVAIEAYRNLLEPPAPAAPTATPMLQTKRSHNA